MDPAKAARDISTHERQEALPRIIAGKAELLNPPAGMDGARLLAALAHVESGFGRVGGRCRVEPSYLPASRQPGTKDGPFFRRHVIDLFALYGDAACASWSSWQLMFPTAWELGYREEPWGLYDDGTAILWVIALLNRRIFGRGAKTVREIADAYNSGDYRDRFQPKGYMDDVERFYHLEAAA